MPQLELVGLAPVQGGEAGDEMDQFSRRGRGRPGGLQFIPPSYRRRARRRHGGHDVGGTRRGVSGVSLARGGRQGTVAGLHGWAQPRVTFHGQSVHVGVHGSVGRAHVAVMLPALGLDFGALREVRPAPLPRLRLAPGAVLLPRLRRGPLDGPILLGEAAACDRAHRHGHAARQKPHGSHPAAAAPRLRNAGKKLPRVMRARKPSERFPRVREVLCPRVSPPAERPPWVFVPHQLPPPPQNVARGWDTPHLAVADAPVSPLQIHPPHTVPPGCAICIKEGDRN